LSQNWCFINPPPVYLLPVLVVLVVLVVVVVVIIVLAVVVVVVRFVGNIFLVLLFLESFGVGFDLVRQST
jgi:hypothetical protein